jgi:hypothetical protein
MWFFQTDGDEDTPSAFPGCVVMTDPLHDFAKCGAPARGGRTVLDLPICDECWNAVAL